MSEETEDDRVGKALVTKSGGEGSGTFTAILSTSEIDRDGEIIEEGAFDPLPKMINIDVDHRTSVLDTVASGRPYYEDGKLMIDGKFASTSKGQEVRTLVNEGHIDTLSVYFRYKDGELAADSRTFMIKDAELLNAGFVSIPANPGAKVVSSKQANKPEQLDPKTGSQDPEKASKASQDLASALTTKSQFDLQQVKDELGIK